jgi:hypothetical protein
MEHTVTAHCRRQIRMGTGPFYPTVELSKEQRMDRRLVGPDGPKYPPGHPSLGRPVTGSGCRTGWRSDSGWSDFTKEYGILGDQGF